jgi:hypothetical protein
MKSTCIIILVSILMVGFLELSSQVVSPGAVNPDQTDNPTASNPYFGQSPPGTNPRRFAPAYIPVGAWGITFSPDGLECFISQNISNVAVIKTSKEINGNWLPLQTASFSGVYWDMESHITPDGSRMYFGSKRPLSGYPTGVGYQWYVDKTDSGWTDPKPMEPPLRGIFMMFPSVADNRNMYYTGGEMGVTSYIALSRYINGNYQEAEILSDSINNLDWPAHPFIAPDESYLIFDACTDQANNVYELFISFRKPDDTWTKAKKIPSNINPGGIPFVSRDGKYFFFWKSTCTMWVDAGFIETMRPLAGPYLGQDPPDTIPLKFAPPSLQANSTWFWHGSPSFSPDLTEMFFVKYFVSTDKTEINYMKMTNGLWSEPVKPSFASTTYIDNNPIFSPSGDTVFFYSQRPGGPFLYVTQEPEGWSDPVSLPVPFPDSLSTTWQFTIARDKTFYFDLWQKQGDIDMYTSERVDGAYVWPVKLGPEINTPYQDWGASPDPLERVMIFASNRPGGFGLHDLYRSLKNPDGRWSEPVNLGNNINGPNEDGFPSLTPDGKYFFFTTARDGDLGYNPYWVKATTVAPLLGAGEVRQSKRKLMLDQNFPNPCSVETTITFSLINRGNVSIILRDVYGKKVMMCIDGEMDPGRHSIEINTSRLTPGIYFYTLKSGYDSITRKMTVF